MSLKYDSQRKVRKKRTKWKVDTAEEYEEREYALLRESLRENVETVVGQVKITAGKAKNVLLDIPKRTRPLTSRMKTQIFDVLSKDIINKTVLDLYAGSGSFGLEAISRGAKEAVFVDASKHAVKALNANILRTGFLTNTEVIKEKVDDFLFQANRDNVKFDLVFVDPPYKEYNKKKMKKIQEILSNASTLLPGIQKNTKKVFPGALIVKHPRTYPIDQIEIEDMKVLETYTYGMNAISIFIFNLQKGK